MSKSLFSFILAGACAPCLCTGLQVGYNFSDYTETEVVDYYGNLNGTLEGEWGALEALTGPGFSGEAGDRALRGADANRIAIKLGELLGTADNPATKWPSFTVEMHVTVTEGMLALDSQRPLTLTGYGLFQKTGTGRPRLTARLEPYLQFEGVVVDQWYHVAITWDAEAQLASYYVDGNLVSTAAAPTLAEEKPEPLLIELISGGGKPWPGGIDNFRFTDSVLEPKNFLLKGFDGEVKTFLGLLVVDGWVDTGTWLGWINVEAAPYVYHPLLGWLYLEEENVTDLETGGWIYFFNL